MVSSYVPIFCIFLVIGTAIAGGDDIPPEIKQKMKEAGEKCKEAGHDAPPPKASAAEMEKGVYACFNRCFMEHMGMMEGDKLNLPEDFPKGAEIKECYEENSKDVTDKCQYVLVFQECIKKILQ